MYQIFKNREEAGVQLAYELLEFAGRRDVMVLALPRGGVPVGFEVARVLELPLDVLIVRKLGVPGQEELAFGAIAPGGVRFLNDAIVNSLRIPDAVVETVVEREMGELDRRERLYRGMRPAVDVERKTVIVVDDGLATGATMQVAIGAIKKMSPKRIVVAVPVAERSTRQELTEKTGVECVCAMMPHPFYAVGVWYDDFRQTTDDEVRECLALAEERVPSAAIAA